MADDPFKYFRIEARELVDQLGKGALELEKGGSSELVGRMLRHAHTLKGAARVVRQPEIADRAHAIEDALTPFRDTATALPRQQVSRVLALLDEIANHVAALGAAGEAAERGRVTHAVEQAPLAVRADLGEVDAVLDGVIEANARLDTVRAGAERLERARQLAELLAAQLAAPGSRSERDAQKQQALAEELRDVVRQVQRELHAGLDQTHRELGQVRESAEQLRLVPVGSLFTLLERTARDTADAVGKQVAFDARGGEARLDAHVLASVQGALVQLVRNAVAHGIELERDRIAAGKPRAGRVHVEVARRGRRAVFTCRDDGRGLDLDAVRAVAIRRGVAAPETLDAGGLVALLLRGGISTTTQVTEVAGRGIGLDIVRAAVENLGGEVQVETRNGAGTVFQLIVPVSLAAIEALVVDAGGTSATIPLDAVLSTRRVTATDVSRSAHGESILHDGAMIPLLRLASALRTDGAAVRTAWAAVVVEVDQRKAAIAVDRVAGTTQVVVRPIPTSADVDAIVAGAALDAQGNPRLVLDPVELVAAAYRERTIAPTAEAPAVSVLVIDDSLTTRMLEQSILESAGYDVDTAVSGEQGLEAARRKRYSLFLVDVEMPGIDGFTFIERARADAALRHTPAILVTSRASPEDRLRGEQVGAQGYIVKSEFDQVELLARIQRLVRGHA